MATEQAQINLGDVQKTLLLPLWGRAKEPKKRKPLLVDEAAIRIIERIDFDFIKGFMIRLIDRYPGSEILFDVSSPLGVKVANKKVIGGEVAAEAGRPGC